jgi:hypothetical protein
MKKFTTYWTLVQDRESADFVPLVIDEFKSPTLATISHVSSQISPTLTRKSDLKRTFHTTKIKPDSLYYRLN